MEMRRDPKEAFPEIIFQENQILLAISKSSLKSV